MSNILDYLDWRGDLKIDRRAPFCEVDNLILTQLSFVDLVGIADGDHLRHSVTLREAAARYLANPAAHADRLGVLIPNEVSTLLEAAAASVRFGNMRLLRFENTIDETLQTQFAALCIVVGDGSFYVSFRGTDDTLVGWKENFNMGFMDSVPAQLLAARYTEAAARAIRGKIRIGGHSKGGNLSLYAASHLPRRLQKRVIAVYNNDGPGFGKSITETEGFAAIAPRVLTVVPQSSVVGLLLEHGKVDKIVKSTGDGVWQHDPYTWEVLGDHFVLADALTPESLRLEKTLKAWVADMTVEQRRDMVEAVYRVFTANNAKTLTDIASDKLDFLLSLGKMDAKTRDIIFSTGKLLLKESLRVSQAERAQAKEERAKKEAARRAKAAAEKQRAEDET
ncbi:MAG: DUF2974 domain-containing protein [Clostridiales bacterium]|nr:DUF2974 domain-containing protein [Clostridiales bacterium]